VGINPRKSRNSQTPWEYDEIILVLPRSREQCQNGAAKSTINSIMLIARTVMVESGLDGQFWFKAAAAGATSRHASRPHLLRQCTESLEVFPEM
jgi:hypothetical protein